jgi:ABC-type branched-subunit amino acid transport system ATPase component
MARPKVLLLDEPSLGLSPLLVDQVFTALEEIKRQGTESKMPVTVRNTLRLLCYDHVTAGVTADIAKRY